jgi:hypothetical protein
VAIIGEDFAIQGNLDPVTLFADVDTIKEQAELILLQADGRKGHIFNLGHGILPETPTEHVAAWLTSSIPILSPPHETSGHHRRRHGGTRRGALSANVPRDRRRLALVRKKRSARGKDVTDREDGFVIEGGPDSFITQKPWGLELCRELGLDDELIPCNTAQQKVYILVRGRSVRYPRISPHRAHPDPAFCEIVAVFLARQTPHGPGTVHVRPNATTKTKASATSSPAVWAAKRRTRSAAR